MTGKLLLLAHGGNLNRGASTAIGCLAVLAGIWMLLKGFNSRASDAPRSGLFGGVFFLIFGYLFLADGQNLPGRQIAGQIVMWWFALPLIVVTLVIARDFRKILTYLRGETKNESLALPQSDLSPEERVRGILRPGETLLWWGVPSPRRFASAMIASVIVGIIPITFSLFFLGLMGRGVIHKGINTNMLPGMLIGGSSAVFFLGIGIACLLYPWKMRSRLREVVYALTDERAIVLTSPRWLWNPVPAANSGNRVMEFSPHQIRHFDRKWRDFGRTDLIFASEWRPGRRGGSWHYFGFLGLDDVDEAERVIRKYYPG